eukprot:PLAT9920.1.p2 GENE.PLAT9920.1~~PLAT9920.1.p2  ORF type:complete len:376 (+),score=139.97 PLAT9920.1:43-1128(+)
MSGLDGGGYSFSAEPRAVDGSSSRRRKYRTTGGKTRNIMHDPRVVRGNTYARAVRPEAERERLGLSDGGRRGGGAARRRRAKAEAEAEFEERPGTPPAVAGRKHIDVQTDSFLEELSDRVPEADAETQTDPFKDRPPSPAFIPTKVGVDKATEIEDGDLFHFDAEVEPILEVLVGKTLEQSMMEVLEEEELESIRKHKERFEQQRNAELAEVQRLEAEHKRRDAEKQRRMEQERARLAREQEVREKMAARSFAKDYLSDLQTTVFDRLQQAGHFFDPVAREVEADFMPWVLSRVSSTVEEMATARACVDATIGHALKLAHDKLEEARAEADDADVDGLLRDATEAAAATLADDSLVDDDDM